MDRAHACMLDGDAGRLALRALRPTAGVLCLPVRAHDVPLLIGGHSARSHSVAPGAAATAGSRSSRSPELDPAELRGRDRDMRAAASEAGRDPAALQVVLRIVESAGRSEELAQRFGSSRPRASTRSSSTSRSRTGRPPSVFARFSEAAAAAGRARRQGRPRHRSLGRDRLGHRRRGRRPGRRVVAHYGGNRERRGGGRCSASRGAAAARPGRPEASRAAREASSRRRSRGAGASTSSS